MKIIGGLGNQMFQYALGRRLSEEKGFPLKLDISKFEKEGVTKRTYSLGVFNLHVEFASKNESDKFFLPSEKYFPRLTKLVKPPILWLSGRHFLKEKEGIFNTHALNVMDNTYLDGAWANAKYFETISEVIQKDFSLKKKLSLISQKYKSQIRHCQSVAIHFRRGDYLTVPKVTNKYNILTLDHYYQAIAILKKKVTRPVFFVFSDDIAWVIKNFKPRQKIVFVKSPPKGLDHEHLYLMSQCQHNIIANSSFSWWSAWLNQNPEKIVIAPKKWLNSGDRSDLILPESWIRL
jgi:hypothetical protein